MPGTLQVAGGRRLPESHGSLARGVPPSSAGTIFTLTLAGGIALGPGEGRTVAFGRCCAAGLPKPVKWAIGGLWFQAVINVLGALLLFFAAGERADHGQSGVGLLRSLAVLSLVIVALPAVCAVKARTGTSWAWGLLTPESREWFGRPS